MGKANLAQEKRIMLFEEVCGVWTGCRLTQEAAALTRAGYVDVPRLLERLGDVKEFRRRPRPLPILNALAFLDFQPARAAENAGLRPSLDPAGSRPPK